MQCTEVKQISLQEFLESKRPKRGTLTVIRDWMLSHGEYKTPFEIAEYLRSIGYIDGVSDSAITARLRDLRKPKFGSYVVSHLPVREGSQAKKYRVSLI